MRIPLTDPLSEWHFARQQEMSARLAAEKNDYAMAIAAAERASPKGHRGAIEITQRNGRWFAVIDGDSGVPKVKARTNA